MKLIDLEADFWKYSGDGAKKHSFELVLSIQVADGIHFLCPKCFRENEGPAGTHSIMISFAGRHCPETADGNPRWIAIGNSLADLTLSPSINLADLEGNAFTCGWHGFVVNGEIR